MRPPSEDIQATIANLVRAGNSVQVAARYAGVPDDVLALWMERGRRGSPAFTPFVNRITRAKAEAALLDNEIVAIAGDADWKAAAHRITVRRQNEELARLRALTT